MYRWKVCPIQGRQLKDVREEDIYGDFRLCNTYRGGGGYDQFPKIAEKRGLSSKGDMGLQFVVQLYGCPLDCFYCYVTRDGIFGEYKEYSTGQLAGAYYRANLKRNAGVFHLMGGAPALYHQNWHRLVDVLPDSVIFHSDFLLTEKPYELNALRMAARPNALYAVDIKGITAEDYHRNTGRKFDERLFWYNLYQVVESGMNFYLTFTNPDMDHYWEFTRRLVRRYGDWIMEDSFIINLIDYEAIK